MNAIHNTTLLVELYVNILKIQIQQNYIYHILLDHDTIHAVELIFIKITTMLQSTLNYLL